MGAADHFPNPVLASFLLFLCQSRRNALLALQSEAVGFSGGQASLSPSAWRRRNVAWPAG